MQNERLSLVLCRHIDQHIPVALGRESQDGEVRLVVKRLARFRDYRQQRAGDVAPENFLERADVVLIDWVLREDEHAVLAWVAAEPDRIVGPFHFAVVIEVAPAWN